MTVAEFIMDASRLWPGEAPWTKPLAFIDLSRTTDIGNELALPPCPVIGIGDAEGPLASCLDAVLQEPVGAEVLVRQVEAAPRAAAAIAQLLRILPGLSLESGLTAESLAYAMLQGSAEHRAWLASRPEPPKQAESEGRIGVEREGTRLVITLERPEAGNAIDRAMRDGLHDAFALAGLDRDIERVSLRAVGKAFSLGAELSEFGTTADPATAHAIRSRTLPAHTAIGCVDRLDVHVSGACVGAGLEIAAYASRFTASANAWFQLPELSMGILPGAGGCVSLTRRIGRQRTALMILSGKRLSARQALAWGLIDAIVDDPA